MPRKIVRAGLQYGTAKVLNGVDSDVAVIIESDVVAILSEADMDFVETYSHILDEVDAPVREGQVLGRLVVTCRGRMIDDVNLVAKVNIREDNLLNRLRHRINCAE